MKKPRTWLTLAEMLEKAKNPHKASGDSSSMETHKLTDLIAARKFLSGTAAVDVNPNRGLRFSKLLPPGAIE